MKLFVSFSLLAIFLSIFSPALVFSSASESGTIDVDLKASSGTDDNSAQREAEAINPDGFSAAERKMIEESAEKHSFEAEVGRLMSIIINSLYTENEVFLRELVSNGSDALDKLRFLSLTDSSQLDSDPNLQIQIKADPETKTLTITDSGIGMTKEELIKNLGRIAQSGTREFLSKLTDKTDNSLIGQFGVGFYSAFLVADRVTVTSKSNGSDKEYVWTSDAENDFEVFENPKGITIARGTRITLHLKETALQYLESSVIRRLISRYSSFINFPIYLWDSEEVERTVDLSEEEIQQQKGEKQKQQEQDGEQVDTIDDIEVPKTKTVKESVWNWYLVNEIKPLWVRAKEDITEQEYNDFYKAIAKDTADPMAHLHFNAEGEIDFRALIYIPSVAPTGMFDNVLGTEKVKSLRLFVKRVFITDQFDDILPKYLSFIRGIIDSDDLPLNVSRETLQHHKTLQLIKKKLVRKIIQLIQDLYDNKDQPELYKKFWSNYATNIKLGVIEDTSNRSRLSKLLLFRSSKSGEDMISLDDYIGRMKPGQEQIYYLAGDSVTTLSKSPLVERLTKRGFEVLYLTEPIDEYAVSSIPKYEEYRLTNVARDSLQFDDEEVDHERMQREREEFEPVINMLRNELSEFVERVVISNRLTTSPVAVVSPQYGYTATMERIIRAQALADPATKSATQFTKKVLEINPRHPVIKELKSRLEADENDKAPRIAARVLYQTAALTSGYEIADPAEFSNWVIQMMQLNLNLPIDATAEEEPEPILKKVEPELHEEL